MKLRLYQWGELLGVLLLLSSTATQIFYVDPLKREIEWRLAAFNMQQNGQLQMKALFDTRVAIMQELKASDAGLKDAEAERAAILARYKTADANISDYLFDKERVENDLQLIVVVLFALGSLLAGVGRAMEMRAAVQSDQLGRLP